ncbi:reverse transcriptase domain-containing protein [Clostridium tertium]|uniref:reverse transcriptase domain-containing protein n=1 Tax=Clostridium tertium TaxID=1559 RepID=UPI0023B26DC6|nr:reverse transcriptase domain-containing protein [Clostridium tertium]
MVNLKNELKCRGYYDAILKRYIDKERDMPKDYEINKYIDLITSGKYEWGIPTLHYIPKDNGKLREIYAFEERDSFILKVINEILFAKCGSYINKSVYSYTKGVRCYNACKSIQKALRNNVPVVGYKLDLSNYFLSVDRKYIINAVNELVEDDFGRNLLKDFFSINQYKYQDTIYTKELALMPGSAVSSFFANFIPNFIDDYIEENAFIYARYADDMIIMAESQEKLDEIYNEVVWLYNTLGLRFNESKREMVTSESPITFLGLTITKQSIDISKKNLKAIKRYIKNSINRIVRKGNLSTTRNALIYLNRSLLGDVFNPVDNIPHTKLAFIYSNITTDKSLKELDFYLKDRLRQAYTGKNNTANIRKLPNEQLVELGLLSITQMYYLSRIGKPFLESEVSILNYNNYIKNNNYIPYIEAPKVDRKALNSINVNLTFEQFYMRTIELNAAFLIEGELVYPEYLNFDLDSHQIRWRDTVIAEGNNLLYDILLVLDDEQGRNVVKVDFSTDLIHIPNTERDRKETLEAKFLISSYQDVYPQGDGRLKRQYNTRINCRTYRFIDLIQYLDAKALNFDIPYRIRKASFNCYLYSHIVSNDLWDGIDYNAGKYINHEFMLFNLVLKRDWFSPEVIKKAI